MLPRISSLQITDPTTHRALLAHRLKIIDARRAEIEAILKTTTGDSYKLQELESELRDLLCQRGEAETILDPPVKQTRSPELQRLYDRQREADRGCFHATLRDRTAYAVAAAEKLEAAGEFRQARL